MWSMKSKIKSMTTESFMKINIKKNSKNILRFRETDKVKEEDL